MDTYAAMNRFKEFLDEYCVDQLMDNFRTGTNHLIIDFMKLLEFDTDLADHVLDDPEEYLKIAEASVREFEMPKTMTRFNVRFENIPETQKLPLSSIRTDKLKKFHIFEGVVRQKSDVLPQTIHAKFECPSCGNIITILQTEKTFKEPTKCGCGRKGKFNLIEKALIDAQSLTLEEGTESLDGGSQAKRRRVILREDLVTPMADKKTNPGTKVQIIGYVKEVPIPTRSGANSTTSDLMIEANFVKSVEDSYAEIEISDDDLKEIKALSKDKNVYKKLIDSIAPRIKGNTKIKEALILQLFGGVKIKLDDGTTLRGDIHILLIGDPGAAKSKFLERINKVAPKSRFVSGEGTSGAGITASVIRDDFSGGWALEAGALVLANKGFVLIDEMDKMNGDDRNHIHTALEQQKVIISKANIQATLQCETSVLAAANPKHGRFDPYELVGKQINMPSTLINRFDLIFPLIDTPDEKKDTEIADFILKSHQNKKSDKSPISTELLRKFISYARQNVFPQLSDEALTDIRNYYVKMRNQGKPHGKGIRPIAISARQLEGIVRLAKASAKTRLSNIATLEDAKRAIKLTQYCLQKVGMDPDTGKIDIDRISSGVSSSERNNISKITEIIRKLEDKFGTIIKIDDIVQEAKKEDIGADKVDEILKKLSRTGDIAYVKGHQIQRIP
jgi:replicative DNA helicase Mcm